MTRFRAKVLAAGKTAAGVEVPEKIVLGLGSTKRPLVKVTINGYTYRSAIAPVGGTYMLGVSNEVRQNTGVAAGDTIDTRSRRRSPAARPWRRASATSPKRCRS